MFGPVRALVPYAKSSLNDGGSDPRNTVTARPRRRASLSLYLTAPKHHFSMIRQIRYFYFICLAADARHESHRKRGGGHLMMNHNRRFPTHFLMLLIFTSGGLSLAWPVSSSGETCSTSNCVQFDEFGTVMGNETYLRKSIYMQLWAFPDACCASSSKPSWCSVKNLVSQGTATRLVMASGTAICTSGGCGSDAYKPYDTNMFVEYVNAERFMCESSE